MATCRQVAMAVIEGVNMTTTKNTLPQKKKYNKYNMISMITLILLFVVWESVVRFGLVDSSRLSSPTEIIQTFIFKLQNTSPDGATIQTHLLASLRVVLIGYFFAVLIGVPLGLFMGFFRFAEALLKPLFEMLRPIPCLAWVPIVLLLFGIGPSGKIFIIFIGSFVSVTINTYTGIKRTKHVLLNVARTAGATEWQMFLRVGLPSAVPMMFTGLRLSLSTAIATIVAAEMVAATSGLGYMMNNGRKLMRTELIFLGVVLCGLLGFLANLIMTKIENRIAPWQEAG